MNEEKAVTTTKEEKAIDFVPYGSADPIKLSVSIIKNLVAVPTRTGKTCSDRDAMKFLMLCRAKRLNPFEGDCFLIGYDSRDGVANFSLITAHQAFLKRAEVHPDFDGMESGVMVKKKDDEGNVDGNEIELEGDYFDDATHQLVGGWARVHFKKRKIPTKRRLKLQRFAKDFGVWKDDPAGMIVKCAEADALRSSFPTMMGGMYMQDEISLPSMNGNGPAQEVPPLPVQVTAPPVEPKVIEQAAAPANPPGVELGNYVVGEGFTFDQFIKWGTETGNIENAEAFTCFGDLPDKLAVRMLRAKTGLKQGLEKIREAQSR